LNYQTFAVAALLEEGENRIEVHVGEGWFSTRLGFNGGKRDIYGDRLAVLAQLEILLENGNQVLYFFQGVDIYYLSLGKHKS
jgi:alpha-L-rhamnosidase